MVREKRKEKGEEGEVMRGKQAREEEGEGRGENREGER